MKMKSIPDYPNYMVTVEGGIWSLARNRQMSPKLNRFKYPVVKLSKGNGKFRTIPVHYLVMFAFVGPRPPGKMIRHIDGIKTNSRPENLEYCSRQTNDADRHRLDEFARGERHGMVKLTENQVKEIREAFKIPRRGLAMHFARKFGVTCGAILFIAKRKTWRHIS